MTFLSPLTLIGLLLVALPVAIHLLVRRRARRLAFPSLRFLRETPSFKLHPRKIRQPLLLALRAAAIILLILGLARPLLTFLEARAAPVRFILMDASLSMKSRGRAAAARDQARTIIKKLPPGERAAIIAFASNATVLDGPTTDQIKLLDAVERYQPSSAAVNYDSGLATVDALLKREPRPTGEIDIISDFQRIDVGTRSEVHAMLPIVTHPVGEQFERNAFSIDESFQRTDRGIEVSATEIVSEADGQSGVRHTWLIDANEGAPPGMDWRTEINGQITGRIRVLAPDNFDEDDERFFAWSPARESRVLLIDDVGTDGPYLLAALEAAGDATTKLTIERNGELPTNPTELGPYSLVVLMLHGAPRGDEAALLGEYARAGGTVLMFLSKDLDSESWSALALSDKARVFPFENLARVNDQSSLTVTDSDYPSLRGLGESPRVALQAVRMTSGYAVTVKSSADTVARWSDGQPAFVASRVGDGRILLFASSPARTSGELGTSASFPVLMSSITRSAAMSRQQLSHEVGESVLLNSALDADVKITNARGQMTETKARELSRQPLAYFGEPGIYKLEYDGRQTFLAINSPPSESERNLLADDEVNRMFATDKTGNPARVTSEWREYAERSGSTWRYFLIAAFLLMIAELLVAMRGARVRRSE